MGRPGSDLLVSVRWVGLDRPAASEHGRLILPCNALPDECSLRTALCPGSFDDVAEGLIIGAAYTNKDDSPALRVDDGQR